MEYGNVGKKSCLVIILIGLAYHIYKDIWALQYAWIVLPAIYACFGKKKDVALQYLLVSYLVYGFYALCGDSRYVLWLLTPLAYIFAIVYAENEIEELSQYKHPGMIGRYNGVLGLNVGDAIVCIMVVVTVMVGFIVLRRNTDSLEGYFLLALSGTLLFDTLESLCRERRSLETYLIDYAIEEKLKSMRTSDGIEALHDAYSVQNGDMWLSEYIFKNGYSYVDELFAPEIINNGRIKLRIDKLLYDAYFNKKEIKYDKRLMYSQYDRNQPSSKLNNNSKYNTCHKCKL